MPQVLVGVWAWKITGVGQRHTDERLGCPGIWRPFLRLWSEADEGKDVFVHISEEGRPWLAQCRRQSELRGRHEPRQGDAENLPVG